MIKKINQNSKDLTPKITQITSIFKTAKINHQLNVLFLLSLPLLRKAPTAQT